MAVVIVGCHGVLISKKALINSAAICGLIELPIPRSVATLPGSLEASGKNARSGGMRLCFPSRQRCQMASRQKLVSHLALSFCSPVLVRCARSLLELSILLLLIAPELPAGNSPRS